MRSNNSGGCQVPLRRQAVLVLLGSLVCSAAWHRALATCLLPVVRHGNILRHLKMAPLDGCEAYGTRVFLQHQRGFLSARHPAPRFRCFQLLGGRGPIFKEGRREFARGKKASLHHDISSRRQPTNKLIAHTPLKYLQKAMGVVLVSLFLSLLPTVAVEPSADGQGTSEKVVHSPQPEWLSPAHVEAQQRELAMPHPRRLRYWTAMQYGTRDEIVEANERLLEGAVETIKEAHYDPTGGAMLSPRDIQEYWKTLRDSSREKAKGDVGPGRIKGHYGETGIELQSVSNQPIPQEAFGSRENAVKGLRWLVSTLHDPYSKYLTREELQHELEGSDDGICGSGAVIESAQVAPQIFPSKLSVCGSQSLCLNNGGSKTGGNAIRMFAPNLMGWFAPEKASPVSSDDAGLVSVDKALKLPVVTAVAPYSLAERSGVVVGDRIFALGGDIFSNMNHEEVEMTLKRWDKNKSWTGELYLTVGKPAVGIRDQIIGYGLSQLHLQAPLSSVDSNVHTHS